MRVGRDRAHPVDRVVDKRRVTESEAGPEQRESNPGLADVQPCQPWARRGLAGT